MAFNEKFTMYDVARLLGLETIADYGDSKYIICPYCGARKRSCNINANFFKCLKCGRQGNYYTLYADLMHITGKDGKTATQVARREILRALSMDGNYSIQKPVATVDKNKNTVKRTPEELDTVYRALVSHLRLTEKHYLDLNERGLSDRQIKGYGFRSVDTERTKEICSLLLKEGLSLEGVPGFYKNRGAWDILTKKEGFFCPAFDADGYLIGFQIRHDEVEDAKYKWLSSKNYRGGTSSGSPSAYYGPKDGCKILYVVDGILKALVCRCLTRRKDIGFLGIAGVNNYRNCKENIKKLQTKGLVKVINAFDMDEFTDTTCKRDHKKCKECSNYDSHYQKGVCEHKALKVEGLKNGSRHLEDTCKEMNLEYSRFTWDLTDDLWNEQVKGLDDYLLERIKRGKKL